MDLNFWQKLKKPFFALAPMADVTDAAFREIIVKYSRHGETGGGPDVFWTEFVSADGLCSPAGREKLIIDLAYSEKERPIVAQLFSSRPENMREAAKIVRELGFDGLDINMGCPDRTIEKQGAGAALIKDFKLAKEIIEAAKDGARFASAGGRMAIPVSVKTRIGYHTDILDEWLDTLLETKPAVITVHARTRKEMSKVPARWGAVERAVKIRNQYQGSDSQGSTLRTQKDSTLIIGNGDVKDLADAESKARETGADGIMLGRAIFGNPWLFDRNKKEISITEKLDVLTEHTKLFEKFFHNKKNSSIMKKHYKAYVNGFDGAKELRVELMEAESAAEVESIVNKFLKG